MEQITDEEIKHLLERYNIDAIDTASCLARIRTDAAEIKRMREALKQITLCQPESIEHNGLDVYIGDTDLMLTSAIEIARDALKGGE